MASAGLLGALGGLGDSLTEVGMTKYKSELAKKLEAEREAKAEERTVAKEQRAERRLRAMPDPAQGTYTEKDGALFYQQRNQFGDILDERLASADEIEKRNYARQQQQNKLKLDDLTMEGKGLLNEVNRAKANSAGQLSALELAVKESQIRKNDAQGNAALIRANKTGSSRSSDDSSTATPSEYAALLKKQAKDIIEQYQAEDDTLTAVEVNNVTRQAVQQAAKFGLDPEELLIQLLDERNYGKPIKK